MNPYTRILLANTIFFGACTAPIKAPVANSVNVEPSKRTLIINQQTNQSVLPRIEVPGIELKIVAGSEKKGFKDGQALAAEFNGPAGVTTDDKGNLYIADINNYRIRKLDRTGLVSTLAGNGKNNPDAKTGPFLETGFAWVFEIMFLKPDTLLSFDQINALKLNLVTQQSVRFIDSDTILKKEPGGTTNLPIPFYGAGDMVFASFQGNIYFGLKHEVWKVSVEPGLYTLERYAGNRNYVKPGVPAGDFLFYYNDGPENEALFNGISGMDFDEKGNLYISDSGNRRIRKISVGSKEVSTLAGTSFIQEGSGSIEPNIKGGFRDGALKDALFQSPGTLKFVTNDSFLVCDSGNKALRLISNKQVRTLINNFHCFGIAQIDQKIYLTDHLNNVLYEMEKHSLNQVIKDLEDQE